jgi:predicted nucleic acid-binding protein
MGYVMKVFFDTSVLVAAVVDQLPQHESALECFLSFSGRGFEPCCSTHTLAESYATLTALPLSRRIQPLEAQRIIEENFFGKLNVLEVKVANYQSVLGRVAKLGLRSGVVYDALHLCCAEMNDCDRLYTFNLRDFERLAPKGVTVVSP